MASVIIYWPVVNFEVCTLETGEKISTISQSFYALILRTEEDAYRTEKLSGMFADLLILQTIYEKKNM